MRRIMMLASLAATTIWGCVELDVEPIPSTSVQKSRAGWTINEPPYPQDLAILFPRSTETSIFANEQLPTGQAYLPSQWHREIAMSYYDTPVGTAFEDESWYQDWQLVAIRIAPCASLMKTLTPDNQERCWPEVRLVWQPTLYDEAIRGVIQPAYSDDRAIHILYRYFGSVDPNVASQLITQEQSNESMASEQFKSYRNIAIDELLVAVKSLRIFSGNAYEELGYRAELEADPETAQRFIDGLKQWLGEVLRSEFAYALTSFSLPSGRQPAGIDLWSFIAFDVEYGSLHRTSIEIVDPLTGKLIGRLPEVETISSGNGDPELISQLDDEELGEALEKQVLASPDQTKGEFANRINDPTQTLVPNTSCGTCHSLNELIFDMHNLSYLESNEITISQRVVNDVGEELRWLKEFLQ